MKNREKYRSEIVEVLKEHNADNGKMCCFLRDNVMPRFTSEEDLERDICGNLEWYTCAMMFAFWLDEEYEEPKKPAVDWSKVPVDTLVRVKDDEEDTWALRYFCGWSENENYGKYRTFPNGTTSKTTTSNYTEYWIYCELVEEEIDQLLKGGDVIDH